MACKKYSLSVKRQRDWSMLLTMCTSRVLPNTWRYNWCWRRAFYLLVNFCLESHKNTQKSILNNQLYPTGIGPTCIDGSEHSWMMKERFFFFNCNQWKRPVDRYQCTQNTQPLFSFYLSGVVEHRLDKAPAHNVSCSIFHFSLSQCLPFYRICCEGYPTNVCEWIFWYKSVFFLALTCQNISNRCQRCRRWSTTGAILLRSTGSPQRTATYSDFIGSHMVLIFNIHPIYAFFSLSLKTELSFFLLYFLFMFIIILFHHLLHFLLDQVAGEPPQLARWFTSNIVSLAPRLFGSLVGWLYRLQFTDQNILMIENTRTPWKIFGFPSGGRRLRCVDGQQQRELLFKVVKQMPP